MIVASHTKLSHNPYPLKRRIAAWIMLSLIALVLGLVFVEMFTSIKTTVTYDNRWWFGYIALLVALVASMWVTFFGAQTGILDGVGLRGKIAYVFGLVVFLSLIPYGAVFSGTPVVLHYLSAKHPGELKLTVIGKGDTYRKHDCSPRVYIREFTASSSEHLCVSEQAFEEIAIGSTVEVRGNISAFGIEPMDISWTKADDD